MMLKMPKSQTPKPSYGPYILAALSDLGGEAEIEQLMDEVYKSMKLLLLPADFDLLYNGSTPRWHSQAIHMLDGLIEEGYVEQNDDHLRLKNKAIKYLSRH